MFKALDDNMINKVDFEWNLDKFMEKMPKGKRYMPVKISYYPHPD